MIVNGPCPNCGSRERRETYDVGSGPELSCASCEWCWGALGQGLQPARLCDHCRDLVRRDRNGFWVGEDETSDCAAHESGHMVGGAIR